MKCPRCLNEDPRYFYQVKGRTYCRKCISYGKIDDRIQVNYSPIKVSYHLDYQLTPQQLYISKELKKRYQNHQDSIVQAVCGAGKTEMIYEVLCFALNQGHKVCFTTPRKSLTIELAQRIKSQFKGIDPVVVYGGHHDCVDGQLIICTTHQLYRYFHCFDLLILDEFDAFPYACNHELEAMVKTSIKGQSIMMSATVKNGDLVLGRRYHQVDLPVPQYKMSGDVMALLQIVLAVYHYRRLQKPVLVFVPTFKDGDRVCRVLQISRLHSFCVTSKTKHTSEIIEQLKQHMLDVIVTTSILERGITIANVQVLIYRGYHPIYNRETLIQIAGRVGRKVPYQTGDVVIYSTRKTQAIKQCIQDIKALNA